MVQVTLGDVWDGLGQPQLYGGCSASSRQPPWMPPPQAGSPTPGLLCHSSLESLSLRNPAFPETKLLEG